MAALESGLRGSLEKAVIQARDQAEASARAALLALAVDKEEAYPSLDADQRRLRNALRARGRQLGGGVQTAGFDPLVEEVAYEQWHRMLFARFLAENGLLMHPEGAQVTLDECEELAPEEGEPDRWLVAAKYASRMLPGIFRTDDPSAQVRFAPEGRAALETILAGLPPAIFTADDGLGWVYQFWQSKKKKEVNASGRKIGGADLAPVTQLFTEDYMVRFLLENSLGAWWARRHPESSLLKDFAYLRFKDDGGPAAGTFEGWPEHVAEVTVIDPCCGSGHFLVVAFEMLLRMRMEEEQLSERDSADAVLRDNLFGLEIDARCVQIGAFALALAAWKAGGYRLLPPLNLACSGIPLAGQLEEWTKLAPDDHNLRYALERLYGLFRQAQDLGSLIDPSTVPVRDRMFTPDFASVAPLLERALSRERAEDPVAAVFGRAAAGVVRAADLLSRQYTLVATNVPYLARGKQVDTLKEFLERLFAEGKADLATALVERCDQLTAANCTWTLVSPQNWFLLGRYRDLRSRLLKNNTWNSVARLGAGAFETIGGEVVNVSLCTITRANPGLGSQMFCIDASTAKSIREKSELLRDSSPRMISQASQTQNPDSKITLDVPSTLPLLSEYAFGLGGITTGDSPRYRRFFWELDQIANGWVVQQSTVNETIAYGGRELVILWENGEGKLCAAANGGGSTIAGREAWGKRGVAVQKMGQLPVTLYTGELFENVAVVVVPKNPEHVASLWAYCQSPEFGSAIRNIDQSIGVTCNTVVKVPFDLARWDRTAKQMYPDGLPEPHSPDPTQWLSKGDPTDSTNPLQVATARLAGYRWPQHDRDSLSALIDDDGIVALAAVGGEEAGTEGLRNLLAEAYGVRWSPAIQEQLLDQVGYAGKTLELWLRDGFFEQHTKLFQQRPFIWQIWDGRKDGFSVLVNYHSLDRPKLDRLIYTYLGAWIATQQSERDANVAGADGRLVAALELQNKLKLIRAGEPPYDIYVRWKPLDKQPIGWDPDVNDGVRLNIRPFIKAGVLRSRVNVNWNKDRGTNPDGSERLNDLHFTNAEKLAARRPAGA